MAYYLILIIILILYLRVFSKSIRQGLLAGFIFTTFTLRGLSWEFINLNLTFILPISFVVLGFLYFIFSQNKLSQVTYYFSKYQMLILSYFVWVTIFIILSQSQEYGTRKTLLFTINSVVPALAISFFAPFNKDDKKIIFFTIVVGSLLTALRVVLRFDLQSRRFDVQPLGYAREIGLGVSLLVIALISEKRLSLKKSLFNSLLVAFGLIAMFFTGSRGPFLGVIIVVASFLAVAGYEKYYNLKKIIRLVGFLLVLILFLFTISSLLRFNIFELRAFERIMTTADIISGDIDDVNTLARLRHFQFSLKGFFESYGLGLGTGGYANFRGHDSMYPHNIIFETAVEQGIVGLIILFSILIMSLKKMILKMRYKELSNYEIALSALWIFGLFTALISSDISSNILWVTLILLWLPNDKNQNKTLVPNNPTLNPTYRTLR